MHIKIDTRFYITIAYRSCCVVTYRGAGRYRNDITLTVIYTHILYSIWYVFFAVYTHKYTLNSVASLRLSLSFARLLTRSSTGRMQYTEQCQIHTIRIQKKIKVYIYTHKLRKKKNNTKENPVPMNIFIEDSCFWCDCMLCVCIFLDSHQK